MARTRPSSLLNPRLSFVGFMLVFFVPIIPLMRPIHLLAVIVGASYFIAGTFFKGEERPTPWPTCTVSPPLILGILGVKLLLLCISLEWNFSPANIILSLAAASIAQKENVAGGVVVNTVIALLLWQNIVGLCQRRHLLWAMATLLAFELLSLQTGRFLLISQLGLIVIIYYEIHRRTFNSVLLAGTVFVLAASFPLLHAVRSGDIASGADIYSWEYVTDIMSADASPGKNFLDLAEYVDDIDYDHGLQVALSPLQFVPRAIWSEKPVTSLQARYTQEIYGIDHLDGVTFTFTIFDSYSAFGIASLAVMSLLWGALFMLMYTRYLHSRRRFMRLQLALMLINAFNFYRGNLLDFAGPILVSFALAALLDRFLPAPEAA